jgi:DNA-binding response OmpR family regulator
MMNPAQTQQTVKTILVVDDEDAIRRGLRRVLTHEGYEVIDAKTGEDAIRLLGERECHLALLDMNMPSLNGWGTLARLRMLQSGLPAIIITARSDQRSLAREIGIDLLEKPINRAILLSRVSKLLHC